MSDRLDRPLIIACYLLASFTGSSTLLRSLVDGTRSVLDSLILIVAATLLLATLVADLADRFSTRHE